jgi:hypothetical protein
MHMVNLSGKDTKAAKPLIMKKLNIKMENDRLKIKNDLEVETTNYMNIDKIAFVFYVNEKGCSNLFVKFVIFVVKKCIALGGNLKIILHFYLSFCFFLFDI